MVSVPEVPAKVWPTWVIAVPLSAIKAIPSSDVMSIVPDVVSLVSLLLVALPSAISPEPAGSAPRAGRPFSLTEAVAAMAPAGLSGVMMIVVGVLLIS